MVSKAFSICLFLAFACARAGPVRKVKRRIPKEFAPPPPAVINSSDVAKIISVTDSLGAEVPHSDFSSRAGLFFPSKFQGSAVECLLLSSSLAVQSIGIKGVDVILPPGFCGSLSCISEWANECHLSVPITNMRLVRLDQADRIHLDNSAKYRVYLCIGSVSEMPFMSPGRLSILIHRSDPSDPLKWKSVGKSYSTYHVVISASLKSAQRFAPNVWEAWRSSRVEVTPSLAVVYPFYVPLSSSATGGGLRSGVALICSSADQFSSLGPKTAEYLKTLAARGTRIFAIVIGRLNALSQTSPGWTTVSSRNASEVASALTAAEFVWRSGDVSEDMDAVLLLAMQLGCIPVASLSSSAEELVADGLEGIIVSDTEPDAFEAAMSKALSLTPEARRTLRANAIRKAAAFTERESRSRMIDLIRRTSLHRPFYQFAAVFLKAIRQRQPVASAPNARHLALIIEPGIVSTFEFCVRQTMFYLGTDWRLEVHHSKLNEAFVKSSLSDIPNVRFVLLPYTMIQSSGYNKMLKDPSFWSEISESKVLLFQSDSFMLKGMN
jgi:hypothetical protein